MAQGGGGKRPPGGIAPPGLTGPLWKEAGAVLEWLRLQASDVYAGIDVPRGDGSPVLVIPGFLCSDLHLQPMRGWLRRIGYRAYESGVRLNVRCPGDVARILARRLDRMHRRTGRPAHLIGHSLGGMLARSLANLRPDRVASVVTLGAPLRGLHSHGLVDVAVRAAATLERLRHRRPKDCMTPACSCETVRAAYSVPESLPFISIYTRGDGVVDWASCRSGRLGCDVEVGGSHLGLMYNPDVYAAIARHLAAASAGAGDQDRTAA